MYLRFLLTDKPRGLVVGEFGPAAVEELEHFSQALGTQAARLYVLKQDVLFERQEQSGLAAACCLGSRVAEDFEGDCTRNRNAHASFAQRVCGDVQGSGEVPFKRLGGIGRGGKDEDVLAV